jgi:hypothetical protein
MRKQVLFVQGAGDGAHEEDAKLAASLRAGLGADYEVRYPRMPDEDSSDAWKRRLAAELGTLADGAILVAHSAGAAALIAILAERASERRVAGLFLIAAPFFGAGGWDAAWFGLPSELGAKLPRGLPVFLYHGRDDEIVPFAHMGLYAKALPHAVVRPLDGRNHQLDDDLSEVAADIRRLG